MATGPATIVVTWADGTTSTYFLPDAAATSGFSDDGKRLVFKAYAVGSEAGFVFTHTLNFAQMRGYQKSWS